MFRFYSPQLLRGVGRREPLGCALSLEQRNPTFACAVHGPGSGATMRGTFRAVLLSALVPLWRPPVAPPHSAHTSPRVTAHTTLLRHQMCAYTVSPPPCLPPPRPSGRARLFRPRAGSGWANMDGNTCCMYFCTGLSMFGVVCLVRCAPLWLPFEALLALKHTDAAHPKCERPHSPSHPVSIGPARTRAPQAPQ